MTKPQQSFSALAFQKQRAEQERVRQQTVQSYDQIGKVLVTFQTPNDEWTFNVSFVNTYIEEPTPSFGAILPPSEPLYPGKFPKITGFVRQWKTVANGPILGYVGATLCAVSEGRVGQNIYITYRFTGRAMSFPVPLGSAAGVAF